MQEHPNGGANRLHPALARMWRWLTFHPIGRQALGLKTNVYAGAFKPAAERSRTSFLGDNAIRSLYEALEFEPAHLRAFYRPLLLTGARRSEISHQKAANLLVERGTPYVMLRFEDAKNDQYHVIQVSPAASEQLEVARSLSGTSQRLFLASGKANDEIPFPVSPTAKNA